MKHMASTDFYVIEVDQVRNRLILTFKGAWLSPDQVPNYLQDHSAAIELLSPGFTALVELREMEAMLLTDYVEKSQMDAVKAGIRKAARIYGERALIKTQTDRINERTGLRSKAFKDQREAEAWLDGS